MMALAAGRWPPLRKGWQARRLKTLATYRVSNVDKVAVNGEIPVRLCNYTDVYYNEMITPALALLCHLLSGGFRWKLTSRFNSLRFPIT